MENHPIPQDITGFQFKLIGNMTVRQFIYLAIGVVIAFFFFFLVPIPLLLKLIIAIISASTGAAFAFLPIDGRPLDVMVGNFLKALFTPTQYIYQKTGGDLSQQASEPSPSHPSLAQPTQFQSISTALPIQQPAPSASQPTPAIQFPTLPNPAISTAPINTPIPEQKTDQKTLALENMLAQIQSQKESLEKELLSLRSSIPTAPAETETAPVSALSAPTPVASEPLFSASPLPQPEPLLKAAASSQTIPPIQTITPTSVQTPTQAPPPPPPPPAPQAQVVPQPQAAPAAPPATPATVMGDPAVKLPIPEAPNLITGIIRDPRGNPLQNIMVEVKDQDGNPVRAFKTNGLGRFASATSLANGKYVLVFEDAKGVNKFDGVQIEAIGNPIIPLEIVSVDPREELRRSLFTNG